MTRSKSQLSPVKANGGLAQPLAEPTVIVVTTPGQTTYGSALNEVFQGTSGDDQIVGLGGADRIEGGAGNDKLHGNRLGLDFFDDPFADSLYGGLGDDLLVGDRGDVIDGGAGRDLFQSTFRASVMPALSLSLSQDSWIRFGGAQSIRLVGIEVIEMTGSSGADTITAGAGNDTFLGRGGADVVALGGGNDLFEGDFQAAFVADGGAGNDRIDIYGIVADVTATSIGGVSVTSGGVTRMAQNFESLGLYFGLVNVTFTGGASHDLLVGGAETSRHVIDMGAGDDRVQITGQARIDLGYGHDTATLTGSGRVVGGYGNDSLWGNGDGGKTLLGGIGNDDLFLSQGSGALYGGTGNDTLSASAGIAAGAILDGGAGIDTVFLAGPSPVTGSFVGADYVSGSLRFTTVERVHLSGSAGADSVSGGAYGDLLAGEGLFPSGATDADTLSGMGGDDTILGGAGRDVLTGGEGADRIEGGSEGDRLQGDAGNDTLTGGTGIDTLIGGAGADVFAFAATERLSMGAGDVISDFAQGVDRIDLTALGPMTFIGAGTFTGRTGELRGFVQGGVTYLRGDMDGNGTADLAIVLTGAFTLTVGDFIL
ncbi:calcium-binding protein [Stagnihabitans tardus]|uniref:Peptidase M10 serralysin C-terminal domain-containing protein n=1 Tax=Stagnihabitans tardus TaxID=2699202 RepID=A0AAE4YFN2_9RHOB|nr:calcium-binding protein [Stagnihabitans tardus]NBZ88785.1 hypothetical protein [Stagnihabitans tardus]